MKFIRFLFPLFVVSFLGQTLNAEGNSTPEIFQYEWSGQYGHISDHGQVIWNQDWMSGPLVIDGAWTHFPFRYGPGVFNQKTSFKLTIPEEETFPDSLIVKNHFDYIRGDYLFDQLEANAVFANETRKIRLNGFKRTFAGAYNQYSNPTYASASPNQQTYRIDYQSKTGTEYINASVAMAVTHTGIPDTLGSAVFQDRFLTAGLHWKKYVEHGTFDIHVSSFSQKMYTSLSLNKTRMHLQHPYLNIRFSRNESRWISGFGVKAQGRSTYDHSELESLIWMDGYLFGKYNRLTWEGGLGLTAVGSPYFSGEFEVDLSRNRWTNTLNYKQNLQGAHPLYSGSIPLEDQNKYWIQKKVCADIHRSFKSGWFRTNMQWSALDISKTNDWLDSFSASVGTGWTIWRGWEIDGYLSSRYKLNELTDGAKNKISTSFTVNEMLFKGNMDASMKLSMDGWMNRQGKTSIHPVYGAPYIINDGTILPDVWLANLEIKAVISSMTITWTVHNLLNTVESGVQQFYPDADQDMFWVKTTPFFTYPEGRLITFGVFWTFDN